MPLIETSNRTIKSLQGLHLYHFWLSSCSQRVRVVLAEKNLSWVDHPIDISPKAMEHATVEYQSIHPKGLVPALVHDGQLVIESIDIIDYLDQQFPTPPLRPTNADGVQEMHKWMDWADTAQHSIKVLTHEFLFKPDRMTSEQLALFLKNHNNRELGDFMKVFCSKEGFPTSEIEAELKTQHDAFVALDKALESQEWLVENTFSLADIAWIPNVRRLDLMLYPLERHPNLLAWYERFKTKPGYYKGVTESEIRPALEHFEEYNKQRRSEGTGIADFKPLTG